jgi:patatin-like phospholipase/acyl hydrolase
MDAGGGHAAAEAGPQAAGTHVHPRDPIRVLSIDGGGVRGIIPARLLVELERIAGRPVRQMFDVIAGTSTGGIIALLLAHPALSK